MIDPAIPINDDGETLATCEANLLKTMPRLRAIDCARAIGDAHLSRRRYQDAAFYYTVARLLSIHVEKTTT